MDDVWQDELHQNNGKFFDFKGNLLTPAQLEHSFNECARWFGMYYRAAKAGSIPDFDATSVKETELDLMREVIHPEHGPLGVSVRGKIDWVIDLDGPVARLADLKTASTSWMARWGAPKADGQLQATAYGYASGKPRLLLRRHPQGERDAHKAPPLNTTAHSGMSDTTACSRTQCSTVRSTDVLNATRVSSRSQILSPIRTHTAVSCVTSRRSARRNSLVVEDALLGRMDGL